MRCPRSWAESSERHQLLYTDRPYSLAVLTPPPTVDDAYMPWSITSAMLS